MPGSDKILDKKKVRKVFESIEKIKKTKMFVDLFDEIKHNEFVIMYMIRNIQNEEGDVKVSDIAEKMMISKPAVSQMINALEDKGYVERVTTKADRRVVYVKLSEAGEKLTNSILDASFQRISDIFEKMGDEDTDTFIRLLDKFFNIIVKDRKNANEANQETHKYNG